MPSYKELRSQFIEKLTPEERVAFSAYLQDADWNVHEAKQYLNHESVWHAVAGSAMSTKSTHEGFER